MKFQDVEQLSAFLDGRLSPAEVARLEARLAVDASMRKVLDDLRVARGLLRRTPRLRAPRNFTLRPTNARVRAPQPRAVPFLRYAGALASILFAFTAALNTVGPTLRQSLASAPAYGFGMGGGVGGGAAEPEAAAEPAPTMDALMAAPAAPAQEAPMPEAPMEDAQAKAAPPAEAPAADLQRGAAPMVPALWIMALAVAGALLIGLSVYIDRMTRRNFRSREMER